MNGKLWRSVATVGVLLSLPNSRGAVAQALREPTIDERFRDGGNKSPDGELPVLNPPQQRPTPNDREPIARSGPAYFGVTFNSDDLEPIVRSVTPSSPAAQAGLQPTDVIESIQGRPVRSYQDVLDIVAKMRPGDTLDIEFSRRMTVRTQAALTNLPPATRRSVGYPPDSEHELLPVPANSPSKTSAIRTQPSRNPSAQSRNGYSSGQRGKSNQGRGQSDDNRRLLGRGQGRR